MYRLGPVSSETWSKARKMGPLKNNSALGRLDSPGALHLQRRPLTQAEKTVEPHALPSHRGPLPYEWVGPFICALGNAGQVRKFFTTADRNSPKPGRTPVMGHAAGSSDQLSSDLSQIDPLIQLQRIIRCPS
jgi:hypothetical protein